jgi:hypothetical protein
MAYTMQQVIDRARVPLNDAAKTKTDPTLLAYANAALHRAYETRPDLLFGSYSTPYADLAVGGTFPLSDRYLQTVADYVSGRAELIDDESSARARGLALLQAFTQELTA